MARNNKFKGAKNNKKKFQNNKKFRKNYNKKPNRYMMVKKQIEKNKESEENLKRQQLAELKYKQKQILNDGTMPSEDEEENSKEHEVNHFQELISTLKRKRKAEEHEAETSESSESEEEDNEQEIKDDIGENESDDEIEEEEAEKSDSENDEIEESELEMSENEEELPESSDIQDKTINTEFLDDSVVHDLNREVVNDLDEEGEFDSDIENEDEKRPENSKSVDTSPFVNHLNYDISPQLFENISANPVKLTSTSLVWPKLGNLIVEIPKESVESVAKKKKITLLGDEEIYANEGTVPKLCNSKYLVNEAFIRQQIVDNIPEVNNRILEATDSNTNVTQLQCEILSIAANYQDFYFPHRTNATGEEIRLSYCVHALNHVLKTRQKVLHHNAKLIKLRESNKQNVIIPDEFRDQGFVRPRVLIILPFRDSAYRVINMLIDLINPKEKNGILNYKRFVDEFTGQTLYFPKKNPKPEDYEQTFAGNTEDTFRIGVSLTKKSLKLYAPFYAADILIASPLGLRLIIGAPGEKDREYDFLASIELLILDQMELFLAQNWDHLLYLFDHLHLQPQSRQNTDFSRVRSWCLNGWSKFYRQTILISSYDLPEFRSLFNNRCKNYHGRVKTANRVEQGTIRHVLMVIPQVFHRIEVKSLESSFDVRFEYFTNTILPQFKSATMAHTMIYVPSYFDYVRIRNYLKKEEINFTQICEYTKDNKISRARTLFYHGGAHFLLYSERAHFFRRMRIKGTRHIIMYQPPLWSNFYPEMLNLMQEANQNPRDDVMKNSMSVTVLYTKYDILQLSAIVGHDNVSKMLSSKRNTHMFMNNE